MKRSALGLLLLVIVLMVAAGSHAATYFTFASGSGNSGGSGGSFLLGSEFTVGSLPIKVTSVGQWAGVGTPFAPLGTTTTVSFWQPTTPGAATGTFLTSGVVPSGTASDAGGFSFAPITPFILNANTTYIVASFGPGFLKGDNTGGVFGPDMTYLRNRVHFPSGSAFPETSNGTTGFWGGTFTYTTNIPEPASMALVALGVGLFLFRRRQR